MGQHSLEARGECWSFADAGVRWAYWWNSTEESPEDVSSDQVLVELNTDFSMKGLSAQEHGNGLARQPLGWIFRHRWCGRREGVLQKHAKDAKKEKLRARVSGSSGTIGAGNSGRMKFIIC